MSKDEHPPFLMIIQNGRLVPASQYDQERLDTYRNGTQVRVRFVEEGQRKPIAKWWAILNRAIKETRTPWNSVEAASSHMKKRCGLTETGIDDAGNWYSKDISLKRLSDPEIEDAIVIMLDKLYEITGVDHAVWREGVKHIDEQTEHESSDGAAKAPDEAAPDITHPPSGAATPPPEPPAPPATPPAPPAPPATKPKSKPGDISRENLVKMLSEMISNKELEAQDKLEILDGSRVLWLDRMPDNEALVKQAFDTTVRSIKGVLPPARAKKILQELE